MEKEFASYELALRLKSIGFDEPCITFYSSKGILQTVLLDIQRGFLPEDLDKGTMAPTFSQAFRWFRIKFNLYHWVTPMHDENSTTFYYEIVDESGLGIHGPIHSLYQTVEKSWTTYEEAELACLEKLLEIVEQQSKL